MRTFSFLPDDMKTSPRQMAYSYSMLVNHIAANGNDSITVNELEEIISITLESNPVSNPLNYY